MRYLLCILLAHSLSSCLQSKNNTAEPLSTTVAVALVSDRTEVNSEIDSIVKPATTAYSYKTKKINTGNTKAQELLAYAILLQGVPYKYGSTNPADGFDCSGFITHVFNHFNIAVPRSSIDFTNLQTEVPLEHAKPGDLILFTGTDSTIRVVGHMGIIKSIDDGTVSFIHSTSGRADGVTITPLNRYYLGRFVKVIRIFK